MARTTTAAALLLLLLALSLPHSLADTNFITLTCSKIRQPGDCVSMLQSDPRSFAADTIRGLADIAFDIAVAGGEAILSKIAKRANQHPGLSEEAALSQCRTLYRNAVDGLGKARAEMDKMSYGAALDLVGSAGEAPRRCEEMFEKLNVASPLSHENKEMGERTGVCYGLVLVQKD